MPNLNMINQEFIERRFSRQHIDGYIREAIETSPMMMEKVVHGVKLLQEWINGQYYDSKMARLEQLKDMDLDKLVIDIFIGIAYFQRDELFTSVSAQMAGRLGFDDKTAAITTVAEIIAVLCMTDAFDIRKPSKMASLMVVSRIPLSEQLIEFIDNSQYLPPMVCEPHVLTCNYDSGYLSHKDSLILGQGNHHDGDLCLDVLNTMNKVALKLDLQFLSTVEEEPTFVIDSQEKQDQWMRFKKQSYQFYSLMEKNGNRFHMTHKVDKRGRIYSCGYHINPQGTAFKKAMLEFADEEIITGVPS